MASKILIVDDEPDVANGWARALRLVGHDVLVANDAPTALHLSRANPFDLAILDYMMPSMTGLELLNELRKYHPFIRSIIISGKLDSSVSEGEMLSQIRTNVEADIYLHKPVENARLKEAVGALIEKRPDRDWQSIAATKLEASVPKKNVRAAEKQLNKKKAKRKK